MVVKELIEKLNKFDPDSEIIFKTEAYGTHYDLDFNRILEDSKDDLNKEVHIVLD